jgi:hypothetical protein
LEILDVIYSIEYFYIICGIENVKKKRKAEIGKQSGKEIMKGSRRKKEKD